MKGHGALDDFQTVSERSIYKMSVEFQVQRRIEKRHQALKRIVATQFVGRANVGQSGPAKMLGLEQLPDKQIPVKHEGAELSRVSAQRFDGARAIDNVRMWRKGDQLFDI